MNINVNFQGLQNFLRAGAYGARLFGNVPFFGPVANQFSSMAGMAGLFTKFGGLSRAITAVTTALAAMATATIYASKMVLGQGIPALATGGTAGQGIMLRGFGAAAGLSTEQIGGLGEKLGGFNRAAAVLAAVRQLQSITTLEGKLAYLRARELEALFPLAFLTREHTRSLEQEKQARAGLFSPEAVTRASAFNFQVERLKRNFSDAGTGIGSVFMPQAERALKWFNDVFGKWIDKSSGGNAGANLNQAAANLNQAAAALSGGARIFGGGIRTQGSLPAALRGEVANQALARGNFWLGDLVP